MRERWKNRFAKKIKIVSICGCGQIKSAAAERCAKCAYKKRWGGRPKKIALAKAKLLKVIEIEELPKLAEPKTVLEIPVIEKSVKQGMELRPFKEDATVTELLARAGCLR